MAIFGCEPLISPWGSTSYIFVELRGSRSKISHFISSIYFKMGSDK